MQKVQLTLMGRMESDSRVYVMIKDTEDAYMSEHGGSVSRTIETGASSAQLCLDRSKLPGGFCSLGVCSTKCIQRSIG